MLFSLALIIVHICIVFYDTVMLENAVACSSLTGSVGKPLLLLGKWTSLPHIFKPS